MSIESECLNYIENKYRNLIEMSYVDFGYQQPYLEPDLYSLLDKIRNNRSSAAPDYDAEMNFLFGNNSYEDAYRKVSKEEDTGFYPPFFSSILVTNVQARSQRNAQM